MDSATTLERLIPDLIAEGDATGRDTLMLHLARYEFAAKQIPQGAQVLDIACGVGYGSSLMADNAESTTRFTGVDMSADSIQYAMEHYKNRRIDYLVADAMTFEKTNFFDVVVSLETIEHLRRPDLFLPSILKSIKPGGVFIGSVPTTPSVDANPHHLHDFTASSFRRMLGEQGLGEIDSLEQRQPFNPIKIVGRKEKRLADMRENLLSYYFRNPKSLLKRIGSTVLHGFNNKYLTIAARKLT